MTIVSRPTYGDTNFPNLFGVCPEPVLANARFLEKTAFKTAFHFRTSSGLSTKQP
jgi:hypothetical protein